MKVSVIDKQTNELLAFVSDKKECIEHDIVSIINCCDIDYDIKAIMYDNSDNKYHTLYFKYKKILWWKKLVLVRESVSK